MNEVPHQTIESRDMLTETGLLPYLARCKQIADYHPFPIIIDKESWNLSQTLIVKLRNKNPVQCTTSKNLPVYNIEPQNHSWHIRPPH